MLFSHYFINYAELCGFSRFVLDSSQSFIQTTFGIKEMPKLSSATLQQTSPPHIKLSGVTMSRLLFLQASSFSTKSFGIRV